MKVIFLDVDGVLNSRSSVIKMNGYGGFFNSQSLESFSKEDIKWDEEVVALLRSVVEETGAKLVISSSWRYMHSPEAFVKMFQAYGWDNAPVIGETSRVMTSYLRGHEIEDWLIRNPLVDRYAIIDDDDDMLDFQMKNLVLTESDFGFQKHDAENVKAILNG